MQLKNIGEALNLFKGIDFGLEESGKLVNILKTVDDSTAKLIVSKSALSIANQNAILTESGHAAATTAAATATTGLAGAEATATTTTTGLSAALKGLWASNSFLVIAAGAVAAIAAIVAVKNAVDDYNEKQLESAKAIAQSATENQNALSDQKAKIEELKTALDNGNLSEQEAYDAKSQLFEIQQQLIGQYGAEAQGIDLVNGSLESQIELLNQLSKEEANKKWNEIDMEYGVDKIKSAMEDEKTYDIGKIPQAYKDSVEKVLDGIDLEFQDDLDGGYIVKFTGDATEAEETLNTIRTRITDLKDENLESEDFFADEFKDWFFKEGFGYADIDTQIKEVSALTSEYKTLYDQILKLELIKNSSEISTPYEKDADKQVKSLAEVYDDYIKAVKDFNDAVISDDKKQITSSLEHFNAVQSAVDEFLAIDGNEAYRSFFDPLTAGLNTTALAAINFSESLNVPRLQKDLERLKNFSKEDLSLITFDDGGRTSLQEESLKRIMEVAKENGVINEVTTANIPVVLDLLVDDGWVSEVQTQSQEAANSASESFSSILSSEDVTKQVDDFQSSISSLDDALESLKNGEDVDVTDLVQEFPELAGKTDNLQEAIGNLKIDKLQEFSEQWRDTFKGLTGDEAVKAQEVLENIISSMDLSDTDLSNFKSIVSENLRIFGGTGSGAGNMSTWNALFEEFGGTAEGREMLIKLSADPSNIYKSIEELRILAKDYLVEIELTASEKSILKLQSQMTTLQEDATKVQDSLSLKEAKGIKPLVSDYTKLVNNSEQQVWNIRQQNAELQKQLAGLDVNDSKYQEIQSQINANVSAINQAKIAQIEWNEQASRLRYEPNEGLTAYNKAKSTRNAGDNYLDMMSGLKEAKEAYDAGLIGTDDFQEYARMISPSGAIDPANFIENYGKVSKWFTESTDGVKSFLNELDSKGLAEFNEETQQWTYSIEDMAEAANQMGTSEEVMLAMFGRLEDYGFSNNYVSSVEDGVQRLSNLYSDLAKEEALLQEMESKPSEYTDEQVQSKKDLIDSIKQNITETGQSMDYVVANAGETYNTQIESAKTAIESLAEQRKNILDNNLYGENSEAVANQLEKQILGLAEENGLQLDVEYNVVGQEDITNATNALRALQENGKISIDLDFNKSDMSVDQLQQKIDELNEAKATINVEDEGGQEALEEINAIISACETEKQLKLALDKGSTVNELLQLTDEELVNELQIDTSQVDDAKQRLQEIAEGEEVPITVKLDESQFTDLTTTTTTANFESEEANFKVNEYKENLDSIPETAPEDGTDVVVNTDEANSKIENVERNLKELDRITAEPNVKVFLGDTLTKISSVANKLALLKDKTITVTTINKEGNYATGTLTNKRPRAAGTLSPAYASGTAYNVLNLKPAFANGTDVALKRDETALLNELGTEGLIRSGKLYEIPGGMHTQALKKGDIILSAKQMEQLRLTGKASGHGQVYGSAYANGTAGGSNPLISSYVNSTVGGGSFQGGAASSSSSTSNTASKTASKIAQEAAKETKTAFEGFQEWLGKLFDWVERSLDKTQKRLDRYVTKAESALDQEKFNTAISSYQKVIELSQNQIANQQTAYEKYMAQAKQVLDVAVRTKDSGVTQAVANEIIVKTANGSMNINEYEDNVREVISAYQEWAEKAETAQSAIDELHYSVLDYTNAIKEAADAQRDASIELAELNSTVGGSFFAFTSSAQKSQLNASTAQLKAQNKAYKTETATLTGNMKTAGSTATSKINTEKKSASGGYKKALENAQSAIKAGKKVSSSDLNVILANNRSVFEQVYAYNSSVDLVETARLEEAVNYATTRTEISQNVVDAYDAKDEKTNDTISLYQSKADNANSVYEKNQYLDVVSDQYHTLLADDIKQVNTWQKTQDSRRKKIASTVGTDKNYNNISANARKTVDKYINAAKSAAKGKGTIGADVLTKLAEFVGKGYVSQSFYQSCIDYNDAIQRRQEAEAQLQIDRQTAIQEQSAINAQKLTNISDSYNEKDDETNAKISLYQSKADNANSTKTKNKYLDKAADQYDTILANDKLEINEIKALEKAERKEVTKSSGRGTNYKGISTNAQKIVDGFIDSAKKAAKNSKEIPATVLAKLSQYVDKGYVSNSFYQSCLDYNEALRKRKEAQSQLEIDEQTAMQEQAAIGVQKIDNIQTNYENKRNSYNSERNKVEYEQNLKLAKGGKLDESDYRKSIEIEKRDMEYYLAEARKIRDQNAQNVRDGLYKEGSQDFLDMEQRALDAEKSAMDCSVEINKLCASINNISLDKLEEMNDMLASMVGYLESILSMTESAGKYNSASTYQKLISGTYDQYKAYKSLGDTARENYIKARDDESGAYNGKSAAEWIVTMYDYYTDANNAISSTYDYQKSLRELPLDKLNDQMGNLQSIFDLLSSEADLKEAEGHYLDVTDYQKQVSAMQSQIAKQEAINAQNKMLYDDAVARGADADAAEYFDAWLSGQSTLDGMKSTVEELNDKIRDDFVTSVQRAIDAIGDMRDVVESEIAIKEAAGQSLNKSDYSSQMGLNTREYEEQLKIQSDRYSKYTQALIAGNEAEAAEMLSQAKQAEAAANNLLASNEKLQKSIQNLFRDTLERELDALDAAQNVLESQMDLIEAQGRDLTRSDYQSQINGLLGLVQQQNALARENERLYNLEMSKGNDVAAAEYLQAWKDAEVEANNLRAEMEELGDAMRENLLTKELDKMLDKLEQLRGSISTVSDLLNEEMMFDDGHLTDFGITSLALNIKEYESDTESLQKLMEKRQKYIEEYAGGMDTYYSRNEFDEDMKNITAEIQSMLSDTATARQAIIDMITKTAQVEMEALNDVIDKRKELLQAQKDAYSFDKTLKSQTNDLALLEKQAQALDGLTDKESMAKLQKLNKQIAEARETLDTTITDHAFDLKIEGLDDLQNSISEAYDNYVHELNANLEAITSSVTDATNTVVGAFGTVEEAINKILNSYGVSGLNQETIGYTRQYARGTTYHTGGSAIINDGNGKREEMVVMPDGSILIPVLPRGSGVLTGEMTQNLMNMATGRNYIPEISIPKIELPQGNNGNASVTIGDIGGIHIYDAVNPENVMAVVQKNIKTIAQGVGTEITKNINRVGSKKSWS